MFASTICFHAQLVICFHKCCASITDLLYWFLVYRNFLVARTCLVAATLQPSTSYIAAAIQLAPVLMHRVLAGTTPTVRTLMIPHVGNSQRAAGPTALGIPF